VRTVIAHSVRAGHVLRSVGRCEATELGRLVGHDLLRHCGLGPNSSPVEQCPFSFSILI
jgi:hypothetical protein